MLNKIGFLVAALLVSSPVLADTMLPYAGAELGYDTGKWRIRDVTSAKKTADSNGVLGGFFAGISWTAAQRVLLNTEAFANESSTSISAQQINIANSGTAQVKLRMRYSYGVAILPGFKFTDAATGYLRLGILKSRFDLHQSTPPSGASSTWDENNATGGQFGAGIQANVGGNWGVRGEYDYVTYNSFTIFGNNISAHDNQFKVGVLYNFY